jgi:hypothetical protein
MIVLPPNADPARPRTSSSLSGRALANIVRLRDRKVLLCVFLGALAGAAVGLHALDPNFIAGTGKWVRPEKDLISYLVAWNYYVVDEWRFPLFNLPAMGYPEGGSVLFNDALPLTALATKTLYQLFGIRINPFGWWIFLTYILQGAMAARLVCAVGVRSVWGCTAAAVLAIVNTAFMSRMAHTALSSHFLLLWALAVHFESLRRGRVRIIECCLLLAVALLVNSYLFAMVFVLEVATFFALRVRGQLRTRDILHGAAAVLVIVALGVVAGYGVFLVNPTSMKSQGFGLYSWNLVGLLVPPDGILGFLEGIPRDATHGQYEGEAYLGRGALGLLVISIAWAPLRILEYVRRYCVYVATLIAFSAYAASNVVYAGSTLVISYGLPEFVVDLCNYFRATGRFIWPLSYSLTILPVALIFRQWKPMFAIAAAVLAVFLQLYEARPSVQWRRYMTAQATEDLIDTPRMNNWLTQHERLWQYPSWACGGLGGSKRAWGNRESNRELQVQLAASRAQIPTNSVYTSRILKSCSEESGWGNNPRLEEGVLYLLGPEAVQASPVLTTLARSDACITVEWAVVCSRQWSRTSREGGSGPRSIK